MIRAQEMQKYALYSRVFKKKEIPVLTSLFEHIERRGASLMIYREYLEQIKSVVKIPAHTLPFDNDTQLDVDLLFTVGGDGTLLMAIEHTVQGRIPVLGINTGRLGFLTSIGRDQVDVMFAELDSGTQWVEKRSLLSLSCCGQSRRPAFGYALNECTVMKTGRTSMLTVDLYADDEFLNSYWSDGLIISTPTGSTGYSLSCGGPIITPDNNSWVITPIAPHDLSTRPLVIRDDRRLQLIVKGRGDAFNCSLDSSSCTYAMETVIDLIRAPFDLQIARLREYSFITTIRKKLRWGGDARKLILSDDV